MNSAYTLETIICLNCYSPFHLFLQIFIADKMPCRFFNVPVVEKWIIRYKLTVRYTHWIWGTEKYLEREDLDLGMFIES